MPESPWAEFFTERSPKVMVWFDSPIQIVMYFQLAWASIIISWMNEDSDLASNLSEIAPSQRKFRFGDSYVALMKVVLASCRVSLSPMMARPSSSTSRKRVRRPESLVSNVRALDFSRTPCTTSEEPSIRAYSSSAFLFFPSLKMSLLSSFLNFFEMVVTSSLKLASTLEQSRWVCEILHFCPLIQLMGAVISIDISMSSFLSLQSSMAQLMSFSQHSYLKLSSSDIGSSDSDYSESESASDELSSFFFESWFWGSPVRH